MNTLDEVNKTIRKSNTSLVGIVCKDGVVLGADRRATAGTLVVSKKERKVVKINDYIVVASTGTVSDIELSQKVMAAELRLKELKTKTRPSVKEAANLVGLMFYRNIRTPTMIPHIVGILIAGVDEDGSTVLYSVEPSGAVFKVEDYDSNFSSGMPYILGLLERQWKKDLSVQEGIELAVESLKASTQRDVASGNGIDVFTITKDGIKQAVSQEIVPTYK